MGESQNSSNKTFLPNFDTLPPIAMQSYLNPNFEEEEVRNWLELPDDLISMILLKVGATEILKNAQYVCSLWYDICKDPSMWCLIDMKMRPLTLCASHLEKMCRPAIDRSCGGLLYINLQYFGSDELLEYITQSSNQLRRLRLVECDDISDEGLIKAVSNLPLLEHLELYLSLFTIETLKAIGQCRPLLKSFKLNHNVYGREPPCKCDKEALAIAGNMPNLRHLQMFGNLLTDKGLQAILDGCPYLESLDLRMCLNLNLEGRLGSICAQKIKNLRLPNDPIDDYEFSHRIIPVDYDAESWRTDVSCEFCDHTIDDGDDSSDFSDTYSIAEDDYYEFSGGRNFCDDYGDFYVS